MGRDHDVRVFVFYQNVLFAHGVKDFLASAPGAVIIGMEPASTAALELARALHPDVVILEEAGADAPVQALFNLPTVARVVTLSIEHNRAHLYAVQRVQVSEPSALAEIVCAADRPIELRAS
jgi:DNA-binding NarL/FixJ family response regulator